MTKHNPKSIFCLVIAFFVDGTNDHYTQGYNFPIGTTPKKISVSELGVIFWGSPLFLAVFGHSHVRGATTLNFGPISTKLGGIVRVIKKMTQKDNGPGLGRNYGETRRLDNNGMVGDPTPPQYTSFVSTTHPKTTNANI